jgi:hypothetical protein
MPKKKDPTKELAKKQQKAAKQASKTARSTKKKGRKEGDDDGDEEDVETILRQLALEDAKRTAVQVAVCERPSARANFSLCPLSSGELIIFGGEFNDGQTNTCFNDLYRYTPGSHGGEWKSVSSPATPAHRCSHQAVVVGNAAMYVIAGEFASNHQFYHYNDTHKVCRCSRFSSSHTLAGAKPSPRHPPTHLARSSIAAGSEHQ